MAMYEALAIRDIRDAADVLRPVYDSTAGADGYVSMEVSPYIAHDTAATHEHMVHQCMSGDVWLRTMLDVDVVSLRSRSRNAASSSSGGMRRTAPEDWHFLAGRTRAGGRRRRRSLMWDARKPG
jgi:hypothetical protein